MDNRRHIFGIVWSLQAHAQYRLTLFKAPAGVRDPAVVTSINNAGEATGYAFMVKTSIDRGVDWTSPSNPTLLKQMAPGAFTNPRAINNVGGICGDAYTEGFRGIYWDNGTPIELPPALSNGGPFVSQCTDLSDHGVMVGSSTGSNGRFIATKWTRYAIVNGQVLITANLGALGPPGANDSEALGVSPSGLLVVGESDLDDLSHEHATLWSNGSMTDLGVLGGQNSVAFGVNDLGQVVGCTDTTTPGARVPFVWQNGVMIPLAVTMDGAGNCARSINSAGQIVGRIDAPTQQEASLTHGAMWQNGVLTDLDTLLHQQVPAGSVVTTARSITDSGRFLVSVDSTSSSTFYLVTPVNPTQVQLTTSANPAFAGDKLTFTATVTSTGHGIPTGSVSFSDGSATLGKVTLNTAGVATFSTASLSLGTHSIVAHYAVHDVYGASDSSQLQQRIIFRMITGPR